MLLMFQKMDSASLSELCERALCSASMIQCISYLRSISLHGKRVQAQSPKPLVRQSSLSVLCSISIPAKDYSSGSLSLTKSRCSSQGPTVGKFITAFTPANLVVRHPHNQWQQMELYQSLLSSMLTIWQARVYVT